MRSLLSVNQTMKVPMIALNVIAQHSLLLSRIGCVSEDYTWGG